MAADVIKDRLGIPLGSVHRIDQLQAVRDSVRALRIPEDTKNILLEILLSFQNEYERAVGREETKEVIWQERR